jgi:aspartyl-tRNA(Asn)/glutamyl-tRNA(Gln) amidotransferase subunit B
LVPASHLAQILHLLLTDKVTNSSAKLLLAKAFDGDLSDPLQLAETEGLLISELPDVEYHVVLDSLIESHPEIVEAIKLKGQKGKIMWFVGQAIQELKRSGNGGAIRPEKLKHLLMEKLKHDDSSPE